MTRLSKILSELTTSQLAAYNQICDLKYYRAEGHRIKTFRSLAKLGLIRLNQDSPYKHDYILSMEEPKRRKKVKVPLVRDVVKNIVGEQKVIVWTSPVKAPTVYSNTSREQYVDKWLNQPVKVNAKRFTPVKCLTHEQMEYIMANHETKTAGEMADHLGKENLEVLLFCQKNAIEPLQSKGKRIGYNTNKKTA